MVSNFRDVGDFHEKFGLARATGWNAKIGPQPWDQELIDFRTKFLEEELKEFKEGVDELDHAKMADALVDLVYVAMGTAHVLGYPWQELWNEVQRANMTKERAKADGSNSLRQSSHDVIKPEGWTPPEVEKILWYHGFGRR